MATYTVEVTYLLPVYRHITVEAETLDDALVKALADDDWEGGKMDYDSSRPEFVSEVWEGDEAYPEKAGPSLDIPFEFSEEGRSSP